MKIFLNILKFIIVSVLICLTMIILKTFSFSTSKLSKKNLVINRLLFSRKEIIETSSNNDLIVNTDNIQHIIGDRLCSVYNQVNAHSIAADIGADHGLLSAALTAKCSHVYAIDVSTSAFEGTKQHVEQCIRKNLIDPKKISLCFGDGIDPLVENNNKCDTIILAGMGADSILNILQKKYSHSRHSNTYVNSSFANIVEYENNVIGNILGIKTIIIQPWPPNILSNHKVNKFLLENNWEYSNQSICENGKNRFITTKFDYNPNHGKIKNIELLSDKYIIESSPLYKEVSQKPFSNNVYIHYLNKEIKSISIKLRGLKNSNNDNNQSTSIETLNDIHSSINNLLDFHNKDNFK